MAMQSMDVLLNIGTLLNITCQARVSITLWSGKPVISFFIYRSGSFCQLFSNYPLFLELRVNSKEQGGVKNLAVQFEFITLNRGKRVAASLLEDLGHPIGQKISQNIIFDCL